MKDTSDKELLSKINEEFLKCNDQKKKKIPKKWQKIITEDRMS